eukprot:TRINITY_DN25580_c0_g1_i1.p1 TRINITY_DN25580_c0_g1~~TRINITY_DN25580_c0_g1_i1.p1  ORF type:complete len:234 (-),score=21.17 TRINITY_DN25580_c0_g1_i1:168-869(-)
MTQDVTVNARESVHSTCTQSSTPTLSSMGTLSHIQVTFGRTENYPSESSECTRRDDRIRTNLSVNSVGTVGTLGHIQYPFGRVRNYPSEISESGVLQEVSRRDTRLQTIDSVATVGTLSHLQVAFERQQSNSQEVVMRSPTGSPRGILKKDAGVNELGGMSGADKYSNVDKPHIRIGGYAIQNADRDSSQVATTIDVPEVVRQISAESSDSSCSTGKKTSSSFLCCDGKGLVV